VSEQFTTVNKANQIFNTVKKTPFSLHFFPVQIIYNNILTGKKNIDLLHLFPLCGK